MKPLLAPLASAWNLTEIFKKSDLFVVGALLIVMAVMAAARSTHYLLFHTMAELFAIVVSFSIFVLAWLSSRYLSNGYLIMLGGSYATVGMVDVLHTLTFRGMNLFPNVTTNHPTQFWLTARFLEALALLWAPFVIDKKPNFYWVSICFAALGTAACIAVVNQWFPLTFVDGVGLTPFKIYSEYVIIGMLIVGLAMLCRFKSHFEPRIFLLLVGSLVLAVFTEFCFTRYVKFFDFTNELGHYLRFLSVALAFMAIVLSGVRQPLELIFREMAQHQHDLAALNAKLQLSESNLTHAQRVAKVGSWHLDIVSQTLIWSDETYRIFGIQPGVAQNLETFASYLHADDQAAVIAAWNLALLRQPYDIEHRILVGDQIRWVREVAEITFAADGTPQAGLGIVQDITERKRIEAALLDSERRMSAVFQSSPIGIIISRLSDGKVLDVNDAILRQFGYTRDEVIGKRTTVELGVYVNPAQRDEMTKRLREQGSVQQFPVDVSTHSGEHIVLEVSGRIIELQGEHCLLAMMSNVTDRNRAEALIREQAFLDPLTRLPNRRLLADRLNQTMHASKRSGCYGALMYLDLDNFKPLNDACGHEVGDLLLIEVADRLRKCVREMDTVARVGGDEFVVMLSELSTDQSDSMAQAQSVAEKVRSTLADVYQLTCKHEGQADTTFLHRCTGSIGVALFDNDDASYKEVICRADEAMYQAKHAGRNMIRFYGTKV